MTAGAFREDRYRDDYEPDNHVKACLPEVALDKLWNSDPAHCHGVFRPFVAKEGLLFCEKAARAPSPEAKSACSPTDTSKY